METLCIAMEVSELDVKSLLLILIEQIKTDKVDTYFISTSEQEKIDIAKAYCKYSLDKIKDCAVAYQTNGNFRILMDELIYIELKKLSEALYKNG